MRAKILCFLIVVLFMAFPVAAADFSGWPTISLFAGGYSFDGPTDLDTEVVYGAKLGYLVDGRSLRERLGIEGVFHQARGTIDRRDVAISQVRLDLLYLLDPWKKLKNLSLFVAVGAGAQFVSGNLATDSDPLMAYGLGCVIPLGDALALRIEGRNVQVFADDARSEFAYTAGLQYRFGTAEKTAEATPAKKTDSDADGVTDARDQCPATPAGVAVDEQGCPVDTADPDGDGVPNYQDRCPDSPAGYPVDAAGCLPDSDGDGVADAFDKCPDNPPGFEVNAEGCMKISN